MSEIKQIKVPDIGDFDDVPVIEVLVAEGDTVEEEQSLITLESDKATMEVPSPVAGKVVKLHVKEGDNVSEGALVAEVETAEAAESEEPEASETAAESEAPEGSEEASGHGDRDSGLGTRDSQPATQRPAAEKPQSGSGDLVYASPSVRRLARELKLDLSGMEGSGRGGRITAEDVFAHVKQGMAGAPAGGAGLQVAPAPQVDFSKFGEIEEEKLSRIKLKSGPALHRNWVSIPHVTQFDEADITDMEAFRKANKDAAEAHGVKMTPLVFLIKAVVASLKAFPNFNASLSADGQSLIYKKYFHVGVAVDTEGGLVVPVIRDCDQKGLMELARELGEISEKARAGKLAPGDMQGGCFSISSLGGIGGTAFTPIINAPEVAILGVSRSEFKPVWNGDEFEGRLMLPLSLSYDHRVIDGADAARFTRHLAGQLEDIRRLLL